MQEKTKLDRKEERKKKTCKEERKNWKIIMKKGWKEVKKMQTIQIEKKPRKL